MSELLNPLFTSAYFLILGALAVYMTTWFLISFFRQRNDVADEAWGLGFIFVSLVAIQLGQKWNNLSSLILLAIVSVWGLRLFWHIFRRHLGRPEDPRYLEYRANWKTLFYLKSYLVIFLFQGLLLFLVASSVIVLNLLPAAPINIVNWLGLVIWIFGFYFEATADAQLKKFISNPDNKGKLMTSGLWRYSRHPNYFGEITMWWGIFIFTLTTTTALVGIVGPITISILILFVSGVPLLEKKYTGQKDWEDYKAKTSVVVPWWPKESK
jgi:steroid 5-alpha reductase family enzyme